MDTDDYVALTRDLYEERFPEFGDVHNITIFKDGTAWTLAGSAHPAELTMALLSRLGELPPPPWDAVSVSGTCYVERHTDIREAIARAGNLAEHPTEETFHCLGVTARTPGELVSVAWKAEMDPLTIDREPLTVMDSAQGSAADALDTLCGIGGIQ